MIRLWTPSNCLQHTRAPERVPEDSAQAHADAARSPVRTTARNSQHVSGGVVSKASRLIFQTPPNVYVLFMKYAVSSALSRQARERVRVYFLLLNTTAQSHTRAPEVRSA